MKRAFVVVLLVGCRSSGKGEDAGLDAAVFANAACDAKDKNNLESCYLEAAQRELQPGYCARIPSPFQADNCYAILAEKRADPSICLRSSSDPPRERCIEKLATSHRDIGICARLDAAGLRAQCIRAVAKTAEDATLCAKVEDVTERDRCYIDNAQTLPTPCKNAVDVDRRDTCFVTAAEKTPALCAEIAAQRVRDRCWSTVAVKELSLCEKVGTPEDVEAHENCYLSAMTRLRPEQCPKMPTPRLREVCIWKTNHGGSGRGVAACADLTIEDVHDDCLVFYSTWTPSACLDVRDVAKKKKCASNVAFPGKEPRLCPLLDGDARKRCFAEAQASAKK